ncbi:MAG: Rieske 2Fe-2S domain-containing protein [Gammaproteobacteria bacterium]|nr:Rieske 2Fe-2S domain-containing protein [Gammaproteobacteria bacterium]MDH5800624.1 Rieske 2Fe-2S domain-containing protein [Gammaproteobacteria bacterium]
MNDHPAVSYPRSWYPLMVGCKIKIGQVKALRAFGKDWVLFRGMDGVPGLVYRYCCHMGADLTKGRVVGNNIECGLHGWCFDNSGFCRNIPALKAHDKGQLQQPKQISLPCREVFGVVFVYYGDRPEYDLPVPDGMSAVMFGDCHQMEFNTEHHVPCLNTFDVQHYRKIHQREFLNEPVVKSEGPFHLGIQMNTRVLPVSMIDRIMWRLTKGEARVVVDCWGGSLLAMSNHKTGYGSIVAMLPIETMKSRLFIIPVKNAHGDRHVTAGLGSRVALLLAAMLIKGFLRPDTILLAGMKPVRGNLLKGVDDIADRYWSFYQGLPVLDSIHE